MKKMLALMSLASFVSCLSATAQVDISNVDSIVVYRKGSVDVITQDRMNKGLVNNPLEALIGQAVPTEPIVWLCSVLCVCVEQLR